MSVLLLILKIIGIVLLAVIGILLLIVALILFVPVRYRINGEAEEHVRIQAHFTWFLHLLAFRFSYENGEFTQSLRIFGIRKKMKKKSEEDEIEADGNAQTAEKMEIPETAAEEMQTERSQQADTTEANEELGNVQEDVTEQNIEPVNMQEDITEQELPLKKSGVFRRICSFFKDIREACLQFIRDCKKKVFDLKNTIANIKEILTEETNKTAVKFLWTEMLVLLKHFRFRKIHTELAFSLGDPALTGQTLGVLSMLPFLYQYEIHVYPDFESDELYLRGTFDVRGRIRGLHFLVLAVRVLGKKECRTVISRIMK